MHRLRRFARLSWSERRLLVRAAFVVGAVRLGLWILPFGTLLRIVERASRPTDLGQALEQTAPRRVAWAVSAASRYVPAASCLTQALAARVLLGQRGCSATLQVGVARNEAGDLEAHAWVEGESGILLGGTDSLRRFQTLPSLEDRLR